MNEKIPQFINYLNNEGLYYYSNTIEELLLSLKLNNILLLNGTSGIGKTKLEEYYSKYYIEENHLNKTIDSFFTIGKTKTSNGFAIKRDSIINLIPKLIYEDKCNFVVDGIKVKGRMNINPRLFFKKEENKEFYDYLDIAKEKGLKKLDLQILLNESNKSYYKIVNANNISQKTINEFIKDAFENRNLNYFLIIDNVSDSNIERILFKKDEIPANLTIFYTGLIKNKSNIVNNLSIINLEAISPLDYLQNNLKNIDLKDIKYLEDFNKDYNSNINDLKKQLQKIQIEDNKSLYNVLVDELNKIYYVLDNENISLSNQNTNMILNFMIISWKYEECPKIFNNWKKYFDFQIIQRILPLLETDENISLETLDKLFKICDDSYFYYRSYNMINEIIEKY